MRYFDNHTRLLYRKKKKPKKKKENLLVTESTCNSHNKQFGLVMIMLLSQSCRNFRTYENAFRFFQVQVVR